ncbi:MAG: hypothetical protein ACOX83_02965 [Candidatus Spyradocola sp.]
MRTPWTPSAWRLAPCSAAAPKKSGECLKELRKILEGRGIKVLPEELICHGKVGLFGGKNPDEEDFAAARKFAQSCMDKALHHEI